MSKINITLGEQSFETDYSIATIARLERTTGEPIQSLFEMSRDHRVPVNVMVKTLPIAFGVNASESATLIEKNGVFAVGEALATYFSWCLYLPDMGKSMDQEGEGDTKKP